MSKENINLNTPIYGIEYEYNMPQSLANTLISAEGKKISDRQQFLVDYVNREFGLLGRCTHVVVG